MFLNKENSLKRYKPVLYLHNGMQMYSNPDRVRCSAMQCLFCLMGAPLPAYVLLLGSLMCPNLFISC
jgi:hypothetical protein